MGSDEPLRIDLFDGEIESLRSFDPETQRTAQRLARIDLLPAREFPLHTDAIERFKIDWYRSFDGDPERCSVFNEVSQGRAPQGAEYYLPLFFDECHSMFDYLPDNTPVVMVGNNFSSANRFWDEVNRRFEEYGVDPRRPLVNPRRGFIPVEELYAAIGNHCVLEFRDSNDVPLHFALDTYTPEPFASEDEFRNVSGIGKLSLLLKAHESPVLLSVESAGRREIILESLAKEGLQAQAVESWEKFQSSGVALGITVTDITRPLFTSPTEPVLVSEDQLFGQRVAQKRRRKIAEETDAQAIIRDLTELRAGLPVVHLEHGVGRYMGLEKLTIEGHDAEFLLLEYANKDKLYVPVGSLHLISRYAGEIRILHRSTDWAPSNGPKPVREPLSEHLTLLHSYWRSTPSVRLERGSRTALMSSRGNCSVQVLPLKKHPIKPPLLMLFVRICVPRKSWIGWSVVMSVSARQKSPCARLSSQPKIKNKLQFWCQLLCLRNNITIILMIVLWIGPLPLKWCRDSKQQKTLPR